jgi:hypothetical protein
MRLCLSGTTATPMQDLVPLLRLLLLWRMMCGAHRPGAQP